MQNENQITISEGQALLDRFKLNAGSISANRGVELSQVLLIQLLGQVGCVGISAYFGLTPNNELTLVLIGYDASGNEMSQLVLDKLKGIPPYHNSSPFSF